MNAIEKAPLRDVLRRHTPARVGLQRAGAAISTAEQLAFQLDHALARDAVHASLDVARLVERVRAMGLQPVVLRSAVEAGAGERQTYLRRPDLGRKLNADSGAALQELAAHATVPDVVFCIADGLSALAIERHALPVLHATLSLVDAERIGPVCVVSQGRVAIGDEIGALLRVKLIVMLIGERPGLSSADSLGVYITWEPRVGRSDAERNCISNVRLEGLSYAEAAQRIVAQINEAQQILGTGVAAKCASRSLLPCGKL